MIIKKPNNQYISNAINFLDTSGNGITEINENKNVIQSKYNSYIASFGGSIIQSGLLATLMIFEANKEKRKIIEIIINLYNDSEIEENQLTKSNEYYYKTLESKEETQVKLIRNKLIDVAVSLKLAMRCYEQVDNSNS